jgi:predicted XRE-type DNA-binding protein
MTQRKTNTPITPSIGNVFADLGFAADEAEHLKLRAQLMGAVREAIQRRALTQAQAAKLLGVTQPRISDLM